ncbi:MAG TPA: ATP-binding cassette domain-containing protein, partial [Polyangiaceae bacterium]|nr:ATP-binding cassette domain-containing protein [Polyangiaceae bacterium]
LSFQGETWDSGRRLGKRPAWLRGVGLVPQEGLLFPHWDVRRNLACGRHGGARPDAAAIELMARRLGIEDLLARSVSCLSGGQRQRVALGRALLSRPKWLLLDEPLGALDFARRRSLLPLLRFVVESTNLPLWFVSHDWAEVRALCDEVVVIEQGRIVSRGPVDSLARSAGGAHDRKARFENLLSGKAVASDGDLSILAVGAQTRLFTPRVTLAPGQSVFVSLFADDIMVALQRPLGISARNVLEALVVAMPTVAAPLVELRLHDGTTLRVQLAERTIRELGLRPFAPVYAVFKANSCQVWADAPEG